MPWYVRGPKGLRWKKKIIGVVVQVGVDRGGFRDTKKKNKKVGNSLFQ